MFKSDGIAFFVRICSLQNEKMYVQKPKLYAMAFKL